MDYQLKNTSEALTSSFTNVYGNKDTLAKALAAPMSVLLFLTVLQHYIFIQNFWIIAYYILLLISHTVVAITTHRVVLLGANSVPEWGMRKIGRRELKFVLYGVVIGLSYGLSFLLLGNIPLGPALAMILGSYVAARLSLIFPAAATDKGWTLKDAWNASRPHQFMMIVVAVVFPLFVGVSEALFRNLPGYFVLAPILSVITNVIVVSALSSAYRIVVQGESKGAEINH